jgi:hypothetical protein
VRKKLLIAKASSGESLASTSYITVPAGGDGLHAQFVSYSLRAQTISGSVTCYVGSRAQSTGTAHKSAIAVYVVSSDGSTVRGTLLALGHAAGNTTIQAVFKSFSWASSASLSSVTTQDNDRLVIELGGMDTDSSANTARLSLGADSAYGNYTSEGDTSTTKNPVCTFSQAIYVREE